MGKELSPQETKKLTLKDLKSYFPGIFAEGANDLNSPLLQADSLYFVRNPKRDVVWHVLAELTVPPQVLINLIYSHPEGGFWALDFYRALVDTGQILHIRLEGPNGRRATQTSGEFVGYGKTFVLDPNAGSITVENGKKQAEFYLNNLSDATISERLAASQAGDAVVITHATQLRRTRNVSVVYCGFPEPDSRGSLIIPYTIAAKK